VFAAILWLLDLYEEHIAPPEPGRGFPEARRFMIAALVLARTPRPVLPPDIGARHGDPSHERAARGDITSRATEVHALRAAVRGAFASSNGISERTSQSTAGSVCSCPT